MNTITYNCKVVAAMLLIVSVILSCIDDTDDSDASVEATTDISYTSFEIEVLSKINEHRNSIGLKALEISNQVSAVAQSHTEHMVNTNKVSHDFFFERLSTLEDNPGADAVSENVAYAYATSGGVVRGWLKSEKHKAIIEGDFTHFGIAIEKDAEGKNYFTNIFISL